MSNREVTSDECSLTGIGVRCNIEVAQKTWCFWLPHIAWLQPFSKDNPY